MAITEVTRLAIFDELHLGRTWWWGRPDEVAFLSRLYRLDQLPSNDYRYADAAGDIRQHCINNDDWEPDWILTDERFELAHSDEKFLQFLATTVHPAVRPDQDEAQQLVGMYNRHLRPDGWELAEITQISGHPVYAARHLLTVPMRVPRVTKVVTAGDTSYVANQITRMEAAIETIPN